MIVGWLLMQSLAFLNVPAALGQGLSLPGKPPFTRNIEPFRSNLETKFLLCDYGAMVKERQPNRWERLALSVMKSDVFAE